jgi:ADP-heptose:LPS heptosyltransferase
MRVVAIVPGGIGNQILFFATLDNLKRHYPNAQINVVVEPQSKAAYLVSKSVHEVITFDFQDRNSLADWGNFVGVIRDREFDVAITVIPDWFIGLILWLTGIPIRIGYQGKGSVFLTHHILLKNSQYMAAMYLDLLQPLGIKSPVPELAINIPKPDLDWALNEQKRLGIQETGYILIYGGSGEVDNYPINHWQQIIQECQRRQPNLPVVVINDGTFGRSLLEVLPGIKLVSADSIGKLAAIIGGASLMLSINGVPLQLSVAVQTYTIALLGTADPVKLLPQSEKVLAIQSPTGEIADISPQVVLQKIWGS